MDPITVRALSLAGSVANGIFTRWLQERTEPGGANSIVAAFKKYIPEPLAQRRAQIQLERVSVSIAEQFQSVFRMEGALLEESAVVAVADAVSRTLEKACVTPQMLADQNLDPTKLVALCRLADPTATKDFSEPEQELYSAILSYATQFICDTASRLPSFNEKTLGEILTREDVILSKFNEVAANFQRIHETLSPSLGLVLKDKFETDFRLAVVRRFGELSLFGLDVSETSRHYNLTVAYVSLAVQQRAAEPPLQHDQVIAGKKKHRDTEPEESEQTISVEDGLDLTPGKTLVVGHAGSGKTTLLQWLAVQVAGRSLEGKLSKYNDCVPFFIRLRDFARSVLPAPESFASLTAPEIGGRMPPAWAHDKLAQAKAILLIDGVDELPRTERSSLREWILSLHAQYPGVAIFLTSRPYASADEWYQHNGFAKVELQPMDLPQIGEFVEHWHDAIASQLNSDAQRAVLTPLANSLKVLLGAQPRLAELASTPLLCAMICALHRDRNQRLPTDRVGLYKACIEALVDRRDPERRINLSDYPDLSFRHKLLLLQDFAYYLLRNGLTEASQDQLESRVTGELPRLGLSPPPSTRDVCRLLVERSGVLREVVAGRVDFIHKTFQEFLAAQSVLDAGDIGLLTSNASDDEWREVIILAAGLAPSRITDQIILSLIQAGDEIKNRRHQLHLLAVGCLGAAAATSEVLREEVGKRIKALVPPANFRDAKDLAAAGELSVPFLRRPEKKLKAQCAAACVRALSLVGTDTALDALKTYAGDARQAVRQELFRAWASFSPDKFADIVLKNEDHVVVSSSVPLSALRRLDKIKTLVVNGGAEFSLAPLLHLRQLENLSVMGRGGLAAADFSDLSKFSSLKELNVWRFGVAAFSSLADLKRLRGVSFSSLSGLRSIGELQKVKSLENIHLNDLPDVDAIPSFQGLANLRSVVINNVGKGQLVRRGCLPSRLLFLKIESPIGFADLDCLGDVTSVSTLHLSARDKDFPIQLLQPHMDRLAPHLQGLGLWRVSGNLDFSILAQCTGLRNLILSGVDGFSNAESLGGDRVPMRIELQSLPDGFDLSPLTKFTHPFDLSIRFIHQPGGLALSPLLGCRALQSLCLEYVYVRDGKALASLEQRIHVDARNVSVRAL